MLNVETVSLPLPLLRHISWAVVTQRKQTELHMLGDIDKTMQKKRKRRKLLRYHHFLPVQQIWSPQLMDTPMDVIASHLDKIWTEQIQTSDNSVLTDSTSVEETFPMSCVARPGLPPIPSVACSAWSILAIRLISVYLGNGRFQKQFDFALFYPFAHHSDMSETFSNSPMLHMDSIMF